MIKTSILFALAAACSLGVFGAETVQQSRAGEHEQVCAALAAKMPPICWILPTVGCR